MTPTITPSATPTATATATPAPSATPTPTGARWPRTSLHYTANANFSSSGQYLPGADGFNLADVSSVSVLNSLGAGVKGLVWIGDCGGADSTLEALVSPFIGNPKLFGFYMVDEPDPSTCLAANLKAEDDWIRTHVPGARTFAILENLGSSTSPTFAKSYTPQNSDLDLIGLDPYPVRSELPSPDDAAISGYVRAAEAAGWSQGAIVPVYQTFGGGTETDDGGGHWAVPTAAEETTMLADWAEVVPAPAFDYAYSWGVQFGDTAMSQLPSLQAAFLAKNTAT